MGEQCSETDEKRSQEISIHRNLPIQTSSGPWGQTLSKDKATPFVVNYEMVDADKDGKISAAEFKTGCGKGWIQKADTSTVKEMKPKQ
jgi:hypothetical protein